MATLSLKAVAVAALLPLTWAQAPVQNQVNVSICSWIQPAAAVIRDTVYFDGGQLWWQRGLSDGTYSGPQDNGNPGAILYSLNFSRKFDTKTDNLTALFDPTPLVGSAGNNIAANYMQGGIVANDDEFIQFGGLVRATDSETPPPADQVLGYEFFQYGPARQSWQPGAILKTLPSGVNRYVSDGAYVSAPSENLGWYFSGERGEDWGEIDTLTLPNITANSLITVDMSVMRAENWTNSSLPTSVPARADAELVWVPVSGSGALVAIGGVVDPVSLTITQSLDQNQTTDSRNSSPGFMQSVAIYDVRGQQWYEQNTTGDVPPQLTQFCSVVAASNDSSSFNVYIYGGYDGLNSTDAPSDDVYILSIPSFTWTKAYTGAPAHGRSGHRCVKPYPDQMLIIGGEFEDPSEGCLDGGIIQVFNLNKLQFQDTYDPTVWSSYAVPSVVTAKIGGGANGGATTKSPSTWSNNELSTLFGTSYSKTIKDWYPYAPSNGTATPTPTGITETHKSSSGLPTWAGAVIGVLVGLFVLTLLAVGYMFWRRKRYIRRNSMSATSSYDGSSTNRIMRWVHGMPTHQSQKAETETTSDDIDDKHSFVTSPTTVDHPNGYAEAAGSQRYEMHGMSAQRPPVELPTPYNLDPGHPGVRGQDFGYNTPPVAFADSRATSEAPSPYVLPSPSPHGSPTSPPVEHPSPPMRATSGASRPGHTRNLSSMSSGVDLPSPDIIVSPEEETRRSAFLQSLPHSGSSSPNTGGPKQSSFGEMLDEHDEHGHEKK